MAGWKKAWLAVLERGGGGSGGALHVHLHGLHSPSSTSSFNFKRTAGVGGSKYHYGSYGNSKAVLVGVSFSLVLAFFYVSVTSGPTADVSFPTPSAASLSPSSSALFSWLSSSTPASVMPRRSLPPHPPIPRNVTSTDQQSNASNTTARAQQEQNAEDSATKEDMGQPAPTTEQTGEQNSHQDARNTTVGSATEPVADSTKAQEQTQEAELPVPLSRIGPGANYSHDPVTGARSDLTDYDGTGNPTGRLTTASTLHGIGSWNQEQRNENATFPMQNSTSQAAMPSSQSHTRIISYKYARRQKEIFRSAQDGAKEEQDNSATAGDQAAATGGDAGIIQPESPGAQSRRPLAQCDVFSGRWVRDDSYSFYPPGSCPHIDDDFNCHKNGRPDSDFLKWRWQPQDCDIPRLNATDFLERLRGKRMIFIGDSLNRNMWESLVCILRNSVTNRTSVYEASGRNQFKTRGYYSFKFREYDCCVDFVRSIFLVKEVIREKDGRVVDEKLRLDELDQSTSAYRTADIIVFNTGHWWTHSKTSKGLNYFQEGNHVYPTLDVTKAYKKGLTTWARWIDKNIDTRRTQVVFRGLALTHFKGGQWNSGGRCHHETEPIFNETYLTEYPSRMRIVEEVLTEMKTPVIYLNISRLTDYRKDAHPSVYRMWYGTAEQRAAAVSRQDCSHWCLPGVPDTWNELLYAALLKAGKGSWRL